MIAGLGLQPLGAQGLRIAIPRPSHLTPVQRLNREGVEQVRRHRYDKAEALFYKAYLYDPADPFTLNNLGYVAELQGQLDRAEKFYALASEQSSDADIALSSRKDLQGKPMTWALSNLKDLPMRINRMNVDAMDLLSQNRNAEADLLLQHALAMDPRNVFTLNNLGVAKEAGGYYEEALSYYEQAASAHSGEPILVTQNDAWRGKPVSQMAGESAKRLRRRMRGLDTAEARAALMNLRGVTAANENNWPAAREYFLKAYSIDPANAFSLNNAGYVAEREGDLETAQFFYARARQAQGADARIGLATQRAVEGTHLVAVASDNNDKAEEQIDLNSEARRHKKRPVELLNRNGTPVAGAAPRPAPSGQPAVTPAPNVQPLFTPGPPRPQTPQ